MGSPLSLVVNGRRIPASPRQTLLEAALASGIVIPHDCATGQCNTCRVKIYQGEVEDAGTRYNDTVLACRSKPLSEAVIEFDEVPDEVSRRGAVTEIVDLTSDIVQLTVAFPQRLPYLPGQYVKASFEGFPSRDYSPTLRLDGSADLNELVFHIRREPDGVVSRELGGRIRVGMRVRVRGPFGHAFHRLGPSRLILVAAGVGWAPIWAVARASRLREPERNVLVVAGARDPANLYMRPCLDWLRKTGAVAILTCSGAGVPEDARAGRPTLHIPHLSADDVVVAAGRQDMVGAVELMAAASGATCYCDPFVPAGAAAQPSVFRRLLRRIASR